LKLQILNLESFVNHTEISHFAQKKRLKFSSRKSFSGQRRKEKFIFLSVGSFSL